MLALSLVLFGCQPASLSFEGQGRVLEKAGRFITIHHSPIPGYMEHTMTMDFELADPSTAAAIQPGDLVGFEIALAEGGALITAINVLPAGTDLALEEEHAAHASATNAAGHQHSDAPAADRAGFAAHVGGLRGIDPANPPAGSGVGRALAFVGDTYVQVVYGRPYKRGRQIFGGLIGYGQVWSTGAHYATEIVLTGPLKVEGQWLSQGVYSVFATPQEETWTIHFNRVLGMHLADRYDSAQDVLTVTVPVEPLPTVVEQHTIDFEPTATGMDLRFSWDQTRVRVGLQRAHL